MKTNQFLFAALTAAFLSVASFSAAQVTIGGSDLPKAGTILDLNPQNGVKGGLALSHISIVSLEHIPDVFGGVTIPTGDRDENTGLTGAVVYNTNPDYGFGVFVWDGYKWQPVGEPYVPYTIIPAPTCLPTLPDLRMTVYNLGADAAKLMAIYPDLSPAKQQMAYQANNAFDETDATVYGDVYQWGRVADGHEKRTASVYETTGALSDTDLDATTGQVASTATGKYGHFIKSPSDDYNWYGGTTPDKDNLWGNGEGLNPQDDNQGGVLSTSDSKYYQNTNWKIPQNNPCPSGWRVPTQDEWERLVDYGCGAPQTAGGSLNVSETENYKSLRDITSTNAPLTWVRVKEGKAFAGTWINDDRSGYAAYRTDVWDAAIGNNGYFDDSGNPDYTRPLYAAAAPEPLLFFPVTGYRNRSTGNLSGTGTYGYYWSSTINNISNSTHSVNFVNEGMTMSTSYRIHGHSVRCVKSL